MRFHRPNLALCLSLVATIAAASLQAQQPTPSLVPGKILLDAWFNSQTRKNASGQTELYHYKWDDTTNSGYSLFGQIFRDHGIATSTLTTAPTVQNLKGAQYYMIVSPDIPAKNPNPHYMTPTDAAQVVKWVKHGGILLLMENDPANADIPHMDILADRFGLHFNNALVHHVVGDDFPAGRIDVLTPAPPFTHPHILYMKDTCSLTLSKTAVPLLTWKGDILMAKAAYGRGLVVAVTDPWLYNEYTDGKKLPSDFDNAAAGQDFVDWLVQQRANLPH